MPRYIMKRLVMMIPVVLGVTFVIFLMLYFSPGEPADFILGDTATAEAKAEFNRLNGLDQPFLIRYFRFLLDALKGNLGISYVTRKPVMAEVCARFPNTLWLAALSMIVATVIGVLLGVLSAVKQYSMIDNIARVLSIVGMSMPSFWVGMMLILFFAVELRMLPASGFSTWKHWILPSVTVGTSVAASIMRMTRSSMLESIRQDYIRTARAKGQTEPVIIWKHAFRNSMIPVLTTAGLQFGKLLGGMAITETVFAVPGIGKMVVDAITVKNAPVVQGGILCIAIAMSLVNLLVDVMYAYIDPRIKTTILKPGERKHQKTGGKEAAETQCNSRQ